ncbi:MAG: PAS domain S-box protein [bacterium]
MTERKDDSPAPPSPESSFSTPENFNPPANELRRIAELATRLLDVPLAGIFIRNNGNTVHLSADPDGDRPWDSLPLIESTLSDPTKPTIVENTTNDTRIDEDGITVSEDTYRTYAGFPFKTDECGNGVVYVMGRTPKEFSSDERNNLQLLSQQARDLLAIARNENEPETSPRTPRPREELKKTKRKFRDLIEQAPLAFLLSNEEFEITQVNQIACEKLGYDREELLGKTLVDINPNYDSKQDIHDVVDDMEPGEIDSFESTHQRKDGTIFPVSIHTRVTRPEMDGRLMCWVRDISGIRDREKTLRKTRNRLRKIIKTAPVAITGINPDGVVEVWNPAAEELFGWSRDEAIGRNLPIVPDDLKDEHETLRQKAIEGEGVENIETRRRTKSGDEIDVLLSTATVKDREANPEIALGIIQDISELKNTQQQLEQALDEKANLLREVHHRVKNNLQIIKSMINLHERQDESKPKNIMDECRDRIQTMAMIHDMLYQSEDLARLPFPGYVDELVSTILRLNDYTSASTEVDLDIEPSIELPLSEAFPCGLIIHELVSNSCKHAFSDDGVNKLRLQLDKTNGNLLLRVSDNGPGFPEDFDPNSIDSVGFDILTSLVEYELGGTIEISNDEMTTVEIRFELDEETP